MDSSLMILLVHTYGLITVPNYTINKHAFGEHNDGMEMSTKHFINYCNCQLTQH
jgi:hypothetical protein